MPLPSDVLAFDSDRTGNHEIFVMGSNGSQVRQLTYDASYECWWPRISPDRRLILFYRAPKGQPENYEQASLWLMRADGTGQCEIHPRGSDGWTIQGHAEWSPDGRQIAMFGTAGAGVEIFITDAQGRNPQQITRRGGINTDVSWSPDGQTLLFNGCPQVSACTEQDYEIYRIPVAGGQALRLTNDRVADFDPYFSPDGGSIAWLAKIDPQAHSGLGAWGIFIMNPDGSNPRIVIADGEINSKPGWSLAGDKIYFHRMRPAHGIRWSIFQIYPNGSGLMEVTHGAPGNNEYPTN